MNKQCPKCEATDTMLKSGRYSTAITPCSHVDQKSNSKNINGVLLNKFTITSINYVTGTRAELHRFYYIQQRQKTEV